jgi:hypothetical protein
MISRFRTGVKSENGRAAVAAKTSVSGHNMLWAIALINGRYCVYPELAFPALKALLPVRRPGRVLRRIQTRRRQRARPGEGAAGLLFGLRCALYAASLAPRPPTVRNGCIGLACASCSSDRPTRAIAGSRSDTACDGNASPDSRASSLPHFAGWVYRITGPAAGFCGAWITATPDGAGANSRHGHTAHALGCLSRTRTRRRRGPRDVLRGCGRTGTMPVTGKREPNSPANRSRFARAVREWKAETKGFQTANFVSVYPLFPELPFGNPFGKQWLTRRE